MHAGLDLATGWPQLLAKAELLADSFVTGGHGRRRAGFGDTFWQFRPAREGTILKKSIGEKQHDQMINLFVNMNGKWLNRFNFGLIVVLACNFPAVAKVNMCVQLA